MASHKPPGLGTAYSDAWPPQVANIDRMVEECLSLGSDEAARRIAAGVEKAVSEGRWQDAVAWQRVRLRARRSGMDLPEPGIVKIVLPRGGRSCL